MFEILDNFTKTPNVIFVIMKFTSGSEYKIVLHIVRQTMGYNKKSDGISISQFVEATGVSSTQVKKAITALKEKKIINVTGQTQKNGGKSYNRYSINLKGVNTLVQKLHKGTAENAQGVLQKLHKGSAENAHTKENRQNTIEQKKRERERGEKNKDFLFLKLSDNLRAKKTDEYIKHLINESEYIKSKTAFNITIRNKLNKGNREQLEDFEKWYLKTECERLEKKHKDKMLAYNFGTYEVEHIYPYFNTVDYVTNYYIYMSLIDVRDKSHKEIKGFNSNASLEDFIKEYEH